MKTSVAGTLVRAAMIVMLVGPRAGGQAMPQSRAYPPEMLDSLPRVLAWPSMPWSDSLVRSGGPTLTTVQFLIDRTGRWERGKLWLVFGWQLGQQALTPLVEDVLNRATFTPAIASGRPERALTQMTIDLGTGEYNIAKSLPDSLSYSELFADTPPERLSGPPMRYPSALLRASVQGEVIVEFVVGIDGVPDPASFRVIASPHPLFTEEALRVMKGSRYKPATFFGRPLKSTVRQPMIFSLRRR